MEAVEAIGNFLFRSCAGLVMMAGFLLGCPLPDPRVFSDADGGASGDVSGLLDVLDGAGVPTPDGTVDAGEDSGGVPGDVTGPGPDLEVSAPDGGDSDAASTESGDAGDGTEDAAEVDVGPACSGEFDCKTQGACADAVPFCGSDGSWECDYSGIAAYDGEVEVRCDGVDNDCDGSVDEEFGVGIPCDGPDGDECANGVRVCAADQQSWICGEESVEDLVEICDEIDNDCDGTVDEGFGPKQLPCDANGDECATGLLLCGEGGSLECVGDVLCSQPNPHCLPASKPLDPDVCGCAPGIFCDPVTASGCPLGKCQCGFLGNACVEGAICNGSQCVIP